jgi:PAS domain S-box-containing protein
VPNDKNEESDILRKESREGYINHDTIRKRKDGSLIPVSISVAPIVIEGQLTGFMGLYKDITERRQAEEALLSAKEFSDSLINSMQDGFSVLDARGVHINVNPAFCRMTGFSREELIGGGIPHPYWAPEIREDIERALYKDIQGELSPPHEVTFIRKNGERFPVILSPSVIRDKQGNVTHVFATAKDVTERKKMEDDLRHYSEHLGELVEERTKELNATQEQLIKSEKMAAIGELATMVAHDLRNPLTGIAGATYYLKKKLSSEMDKKTKEMIDIIEKDIKYSNKIVTDLLEYSRDMRLELTETNSSSIIREALSMVDVPLNIQVSEVSDLTRSESKIKVDLEKMARVLVNIILNAIDAMPEGGKLTINSWEKEGKLAIAVSDTGAGMSPDILEKLWTPFFTTKAKGMGLGLSICKRIVEAHEGSISVESAIGKGTTVTVTIPTLLS